MPEPLTTAATLGKFYKELIEEGVPEHVCDLIVRDVAQTITHEDGYLAVKA